MLRGATGLWFMVQVLWFMVYCLEVRASAFIMEPSTIGTSKHVTHDLRSEAGVKLSVYAQQYPRAVVSGIVDAIQMHLG